MKTIELTKDFFTVVDDSDFKYLSQFRWHYNCGYAERKENGKHVRMHREIAKASKNEIVDHINGNGLDNRRENLRFVTKSQNAMNMRKIGYKGVSKDKNNYRVQIMKNGKRVFSESAPKERWAGMIYDLNAPALFGQYASLNFPSALRG